MELSNYWYLWPKRLNLQDTTRNSNSYYVCIWTVCVGCTKVKTRLQGWNIHPPEWNLRQCLFSGKPRMDPLSFVFPHHCWNNTMKTTHIFSYLVNNMYKRFLLFIKFNRKPSIWYLVILLYNIKEVKFEPVYTQINITRRSSGKISIKCMSKIYVIERKYLWITPSTQGYIC